MTAGKVRRAQLVTPFGVGALSTLVDGSSVITAGLDHWFAPPDAGAISVDEFVVREWRLERRLGVQQFRLPPDFRTRAPSRSTPTNVRLSVPALRFPQWSFCMYCKRLKRSPLSMTQRVHCDDPKHNGSKRGPVMAQVPFVATCQRGHLEDFPFSEWVHQSGRPGCTGTLRLKSRGEASLSGQFVECDGCKRKRNLDRVLTASIGDDGIESTFLSEKLEPGTTFSCSGSRPWVGDPGQGCGQPLRGALRGAGNLYFPKVESAIFLPPFEGGASAEVLDILRRADVQPRLTMLHSLLGMVEPEQLRQHVDPVLLGPISDEQLKLAIDEIVGPSEPAAPETAEDLAPPEVWRRPEYDLVRSTPAHPDLTCTDPGVSPTLAASFARVRRVETLRETRVLRGFSRVSDRPLRLTEGKALLRKQAVPASHDWLPAYVVRGEGIYIELNEQRLREWEQSPAPMQRAAKIQRASNTLTRGRGLEDRAISPRFLLVHTLAHLLINELVFACGYGSASLRERLYVSSDEKDPMAGILIYTAAGDSEGTMGGLVRMALPQHLGPLVDRAITAAGWCSTDPVCMELGESGQGPGSCNLAACHACALLPETSCEEFNSYLDRAAIVGTPSNRGLGFFNNGWNGSA